MVEKKKMDVSESVFERLRKVSPGADEDELWSKAKRSVKVLKKIR